MPFYSPSTGGFYEKGIHGRNMPADVVSITNRQREELMLAQRQGHEIVATATGPTIRKRLTEEGFALRVAVARVKREAKRRILAIASLEQQSNDNAAIALAAFKRAKGDSTVILPAIERRQKIDEVRAASNRIEAALAKYTDDELAVFSAASAAWPGN